MDARWMLGTRIQKLTTMAPELDFYWSGRRDSNPRPSPWQVGQPRNTREAPKDSPWSGYFSTSPERFRKVPTAG